MDSQQRILLGAIGGLTPYLVTLLSIDFKSVVGSYELLDWVGLGIRCLVLMFLGSLVAYLHKAETEPFKVFQLGLAAPALLAAIINGNAGNHQTLPSPVGNQPVTSFALISSAYAEEEVSYINQGMLREPKVSASSRFFRGLFGTKLKTSEEEAYFVIVGSHLKQEDAENQADSLANDGYTAKVYSPLLHLPYYAVVIAANVTEAEALAIKEQAIENGLPDDSYIWTY